MSKIKVMDEQLSNRIAAGEVIERPASVVKELVENAIDAGATHIRIEIERAGSRLISVSDNGSGMDADDALLCIEPHGTSKIFTAEDIDRITTLGFRGEALPSIASISRFTILTRTAEMLEGTRVRIEGGRLLEAAPAGCAAGTVMQVRDLFFNTPARKKFLKSPATEAHHIEETVLGLALPRPEVGFELRIDGRTAFRSPAAPTPEARLRELFGRPFVAVAGQPYRIGHHHHRIHRRAGLHPQLPAGTADLRQRTGGRICRDLPGDPRRLRDAHRERQICASGALSHPCAGGGGCQRASGQAGDPLQA